MRSRMAPFNMRCATPRVHLESPALMKTALSIRSCFPARRARHVLPAVRASAILVISGAGLACTLHAQSSSGGDESWSNVTALANAAAAPVIVSSPQSPETLRAAEKERTDKFRAAATAAGDFKTTYPDHAKSAHARKLEVLAMLEATAAESAEQRGQALATADAYRRDTRNAPSDRFQVASAVERGELSRRLEGAPWYANAIEAERMGDRLRKEFGELPEVYGTYLSIAEDASCFNSGDVAIKILQATPPPGIRRSAQRVLDRWKMIGRPLELSLNTFDGSTTSLSTLAGRRTVIVLYSTDADPAGPRGLDAFRNAPPSGVNWVYIALGSAPAQPGITTAVVPGPLCVDTLGSQGHVARELKVSKLPAVYVLDDKRTLFGFGRIDQLPWLLGLSDPARHDHSAP
jgi:hypothetical protein